MSELAAKAHAAADALNRNDLDGFLELMHPQVEFRSLIAEVDGQTFRGHEGVLEWWASVRGAFESVHWDYRDVRAKGDRGVARVEITGTLGGVPVHQTMWQAMVMEDGQARWWRFYRTEEDALEAVSDG